MKLNNWWEPASPDSTTESVANTITRVLLTALGILLFCSALWQMLLAWQIQSASSRSGMLAGAGTIQNPSHLFLIQWALLVSFGVVELSMILAMVGLREPGKGITAAGIATILCLCAIWISSFQKVLPAFAFANLLSAQNAIYVTASVQQLVGLFLVFGNETFSQMICNRYFPANVPSGEPIH
ncbi:hypothetical protein GC207_06775 [bacterium]|nr:hypothetical protein [bacterium]